MRKTNRNHNAMPFGLSVYGPASTTSELCFGGRFVGAGDDTVTLGVPSIATQGDSAWRPPDC